MPITTSSNGILRTLATQYTCLLTLIKLCIIWQNECKRILSRFQCVLPPMYIFYNNSLTCDCICFTYRYILRVANLFILIIYPSFILSSMALQPFAGRWPLLQFRNHIYTDGRTPWTSDQPVSRPLSAQDNTNIE
jgi:hypothetical protein